jgi:putative membrane protein insertion efficiency factor
MQSLLNNFLIGLVRLYRWVLSPAKNLLFGPLGRCRFEPSCSAYALEALRRHGPFRGSCLALKRIGRCNPWGGCGHDPVPQTPGEHRKEAPAPTERVNTPGAGMVSVPR